MATDERKISVAIPTWQRSEMTLDSFIDVYDDERISEFVIVDDASEWGIFDELKRFVENLPKVRLFRNSTNNDCYFNKARSLCHSTNDWCILLDSDNKISKGYIDKLFEIPHWDENTIYTPDFAQPQFDFRQYSGLLLTKENISEWIDKPILETMLNAANYFVNRHGYLEVWDEHTDPVTSDSIFMISRWLEAGKRLQVVDGLQYFHRVHPGSHYQNNRHRTQQGFHESILTTLRQMK